MKVSFFSKTLIFICALSLIAPAYTQDAAKPAKLNTPHQVVEKTTEKLMSVVKAHQGTYEANPDKYFDEVESVLDPVIDFSFIAKSVMGPYWKTASAEQQEKFTKTFKRGLVNTYAKGMAKFNDLKIEVVPPEEAVPEFGTVTVVQKVSAADGVNRVAYKMGRKKSGGDWMLINVVLDGVNLGKTFRSQFAQAVKEHEGNLDAAIAGWSS